MIKNLNEKEELALRDFLAKISKRFGGNYLYSLMFGSKARGDAHGGSDLDVAVVTVSYRNHYSKIWPESKRAHDVWTKNIFLILYFIAQAILRAVE